MLPAIAKKIVLSALLFTPVSYATTDIDTVKTTIIATLQRNNPAIIGEFKRLCRRYDQIVFNFFDGKNNDSLRTHINYMEVELRLLKNACDNGEFRSVHVTLTTYYEHLRNLIAILKQYIGSRNTLTLALKVRSYKFLLPQAVKQKGDFALLGALNHRLRC